MRRLHIDGQIISIDEKDSSIKAKFWYQLRGQEYPFYVDYLDAKVKQGSTDQALQEEGIAQEKAYIDACLAVKQKYPKP